MGKLIGIEEIAEGMELASAVKNKYGQVLLGSGLLIGDKHKKLLRMWGIQNIYIKSEESSDNKIEYDEKTIEKAKELLSKRLFWKPKNKIEEELCDIALQIVLEKNF